MRVKGTIKVTIPADETSWERTVAHSRLVAAANALGYAADNEPILDQLRVFIVALDVYAERNKKYKDNWRRMGWRGQLIRIRERAERVWDDLWDAHGGPFKPTTTLDAPDVDDAIDLINFAGFLVRGVREGNRDGDWWGVN